MLTVRYGHFPLSHHLSLLTPPNPSPSHSHSLTRSKKKTKYEKPNAKHEKTKIFFLKKTDSGKNKMARTQQKQTHEDF